MQPRQNDDEKLIPKTALSPETAGAEAPASALRLNPGEWRDRAR